MKRILSEPLLHFLFLGVVIFAAYGWFSRHTNEPGTIVVSQGQIASMVVGFTRTWQRPPTGEELEGLIQDRVREEVYYREALALGLDKDDTIIRRRLRQKMEFLTEDLIAETEPTDDELSAYLEAHPDVFRVQQLFTFSQVYLNPERRRETLARDTTQLLAQLNQAGAEADVSALGDSFLLEHSFADASAVEIAQRFGEQFAAKLGEVPPGRWHGPVESGYGVHLVFVGKRTEGRLPVLAEVRDAVRREWANARRLEENERSYRELLEQYEVAIEPPQPAETTLAEMGR